jgi:thiol:disulfide interchange protein DsbD
VPRPLAGALAALVSVSLAGGCAPTPSTEPAAPTPTVAASPTPVAEPAGLVGAELVADADAIAPGQRFTLAVALTIAPGYHIYWLNPGESGLATQVSFRLPERVATGAVRFEGPTAFTSPGAVVSYGYEGAAMMSIEAEAPRDVGGPLDAAVEVEYVACKADECVPGAVDATLALPIDAAPAAGSPGRAAERFAAHAARLPRPFAELAGARATWGRRDDHPVLELVLPTADDLTYFPSPAESATYDGAIAIYGRPATIKIRYKVGATPAAGGVLRVDDRGTTRYYQLAINAGGTR